MKVLYPYGIHTYLKNTFGTHENFNIKTTTLDEPEHGLTDEILEWTDVLLWLGHKAHSEVNDYIVDKIQQKIL